MPEDAPWAQYEIDYHVERLRQNRLAGRKGSARSETPQGYLATTGRLARDGFGRTADWARGAWARVQAARHGSSEPEEQCC